MKEESSALGGLVLVVVLLAAGAVMQGCASTSVSIDPNNKETIQMNSSTFLGMGTDYADRVGQQGNVK